MRLYEKFVKFWYRRICKERKQKSWLWCSRKILFKDCRGSKVTFSGWMSRTLKFAAKVKPPQLKKKFYLTSLFVVVFIREQWESSALFPVRAGMRHKLTFTLTPKRIVQLNRKHDSWQFQELIGKSATIYFLMEAKRRVFFLIKRNIWQCFWKSEINAEAPEYLLKWSFFFVCLLIYKTHMSSKKWALLSKLMFLLKLTLKRRLEQQQYNVKLVFLSISFGAAIPAQEAESNKNYNTNESSSFVKFYKDIFQK